MRPARRLTVTLAVMLVALFAVAAALAQEGDGDKVTLTVGLTGNDFDSLNPVVGYSVPSYEFWNLQYATLTDKAAADFATVPGLAESWKASNDGKTYTYTLRDGLTWSDGTPLTADDVVFTIDRGRKEAWLNYDATVKNLTARAIDDRTVEIRSSVPDPKLPTMDVYLLPKHIWEAYDAKAVTKYDALDGVGSGPFTLDEWKRGQYLRLKANPSYWGGEPAIDEVVFRIFNNADAMVAALEKGEIDAAHNVPSQAFGRLEGTDGIVAVQGLQGGFDEIAINGGAGLKKPHPALLDRRVRVAIAHAIDKQALLDRVYLGIGSVAEAVSPSANPAWTPTIPADKQFAFDPEQARAILDAAGYEDTNGDGVREMPGGGEKLDFTFFARSNSDTSPQVAEFVSGWLKDIGIAVTVKSVDSNQLGPIIGKGEYDMFHWAWTPFVDPDPMLSYFTCGQVASDPNDPTNYYNDANWCDKRYDALYEQQNVELDVDKRMEIVHRMLTLFQQTAVYQVFALTPDLQGYRTDRFEGWVRQPAEVGPVLFSNTSPTYALLTPVASSGGGGGGVSTGAIAAIAVVGVGLAALAVLLLRRRRTADERE